MATSSVSIDLGPVIRQVQQVGSQLSTQIDSVSTEVGNVRGDLRLTSDELRQLKADFEAFRERTERIASVQVAETKVVALRAELDRQFGHYGVVRRTSVGVLQGFDVGNVSSATVTTVSEELMIQSPRYWLAPALVTLAAWTRDDPDIAERSTQEAFSRDKNKTSLFFALVLRRQGRLESAVRWLRHYFVSLDPMALTREFAVILEATSYDAFGPAGQAVAAEAMTTWSQRLRSQPQIVDAQVSQWAAEIAVQRDKLDPNAFPALAGLSPQWPTIEYQIEMSSALPKTIEKYDAVRRHDSALPSVLEDMLDDILDQLVTEYDDEELPLKRDVVYYEAIIEEDGDLDRARARADELNRALEETTDVVSMQTQAAINPENLGVSVQTQRIAIGVGQQDFRSAVGQYCAVYRQQALDRVDLNFSTTHSNFAQTYSFKGCSISTAEDEDTGGKRLNQAWDETFLPHFKAAEYNNSKLVVPALIAGGIALVLLIANPALGVVAGLVGGLVVWLMSKKAREAAEQAKAQLFTALNQAKENSLGQYRDATAQFVDAQLMFQELDGHESDLLRLIDTWPTATGKIVEVA